jgi:hypothetical protein
MEAATPHHLDWVFSLLILLGIILLWARFAFTKRLAFLAGFAFTSEIKTQKQDADQSYPGNFVAALYTIYLSGLVLLGIGVLNQWGLLELSHKTWRVFLQFFFIIGLFLVLRNLVIKLVSLIFNQPLLGDLWLDYLTRYRLSIGIWLLPLLFIAYFSEDLSRFWFIVSLAYVGTLSVFHVFRASLRLHNETRVPYYRIFLYLCTLEISPLIWGGFLILRS